MLHCLCQIEKRPRRRLGAPRDLAHNHILEGVIVGERSLAQETTEHPTTEQRPCACYGGWVFVGYIDEYGEEREASYPCRRCSETS
jgi:hypothetical protein